MLPPKSRIFEALVLQVDQKFASFEKQLLDLDRSAEEETKSSAGDKYETSIEMLKQEQEKLSKQMRLQREMKNQLKEMKIVETSKVALGSVVQTQDNVFFISIPFGKISVDGVEIMCISLAAPITQALIGLQVGDTINFQSKQVRIIALN